jgi:hypothetical protein
LICVAENGRKTVEDAEPAFLSAQDLVTRIKALPDFDDRKDVERFRWLQSPADFVVLDTRFDQDVAMAGFTRPYGRRSPCFVQRHPARMGEVLKFQGAVRK